MSDPDAPDFNFNLVRALNGAALVVLDEDLQLVFAWYGGRRISVWSYEGVMEDQIPFVKTDEVNRYTALETIDCYRRHH